MPDLTAKVIQAPDRQRSLVTAFERVATKFASRLALSSDVWQPTYRELNETANRLAHRLVANGGSLGDRAAILMSHDAPMIAAVLGALKAGQIMVPLDPGDPISRLKMLVEDAEPSVIVTDAQNRKLAAEFAPPGCRILNFSSETTTGPVENLSIEIRPEQTAYLTYTSGTTGNPKGVMKSHRQSLRNIAAHTEAMQFTENDRIPLFAMISTGQGGLAIWLPLLNGAMGCPFPVKTRGVTGLADWMIDRGLTVYVSSASIFRALVKTIDDRLVFANVRAVRLSSEAIAADDVSAIRKHFPPKSILVHGLSSSETAPIAWSRWVLEDQIPDGVLPVGHFAKDIEVALVGDDRQPVARGEVGEIVVKSRYVANGYWRDPKLTAERFSADLDGNGTRMVWTGDLGRINADGMLEFCGRKDDRIKIRGNRIEVLEIERVLESLAGIDRAAVVAIRHENHGPLLVAFVVKTSQGSWTAPRLRHAVRANLPPHMVPSRFVFLDSLPYNKGNKIDREALRQHVFPAPNDSKHERPRTETEMLLAEIWSESLELLNVSQNHDFFDLGGDSLKAAIVAAQVHAALGVDLGLGTIADHPTISALATYIDKCLRVGPAGMPPIARAPRASFMPLSLNQELCWPHRGTPILTYLRRSRIIGPLDVELYKECLVYLVHRHEILRTTIRIVEGRPAQVIHRSAPLSFTFIDLAGHVDPEGQADAIFQDAGAQVIDLETLPLMRHVLIKVADDQYRLAHVVSTMLSDGFSNRMLDAELAVLYEAKLQGRQPPLPKQAPLQYADYAVWERQITQPNNPFSKELSDWWKNICSIAPPVTRLPLTRLTRHTNLDPAEGVLGWTLEERTAKRLDEIARGAGTTPFVIRLAAFAALIADLTGSSTVVICTMFDNRNRTDVRTIAGPFVNIVPLVFSFDASKTFRQWLENVHSSLFKTLAHGELPFYSIKEQLQTAGINSPQSNITFMLSSDNADQTFGKLCISNESVTVGTMPLGFTVYVDGRKPENCQVRFDAGLYNRKEVNALLKRYLRLLEISGREPDLPIGNLLAMLGTKPLRWMCRKNAEPIYDLLLTSYAASPLLRMFWRPIKKVVGSAMFAFGAKRR